jgi:hypothetical protein
VNTNESTGQMSASDFNELLTLVSQLRGFPSRDDKDVYGLDTKLDLHSFEMSWSNAEADPSAADVNEIVEDETKQTFKDVVDSIESAASQFAR